jgi:hypothetical protein
MIAQSLSSASPISGRTTSLIPSITRGIQSKKHRTHYAHPLYIHQSVFTPRESTKAGSRNWHGFGQKHETRAVKFRHETRVHTGPRIEELAG